MKAYDFIEAQLGKQKAMVTHVDGAANKFFDSSKEESANNCPIQLNFVFTMENGATVYKNFVKPIKAGFYKVLADIGKINLDNHEMTDFIGVEFPAEVIEGKNGYKDIIIDITSDELKKN